MIDDRLTPEESEAFNTGFETAFNGGDDIADNHYEHGSSCFSSFIDGFAYFHEHEAMQERERQAKLFKPSVDKILAALQGLTMDQIAERIGIPTGEWPGRCFEIASLLIKAFNWDEDAEAVYGLYLGPISAKCTTFDKAAEGCIRHGWVLTRENIIVDPTAWVFAAKEPALRVLQPGTESHFKLAEYYDEGAESMAPTLQAVFPATTKGATVFKVANPKLLKWLQMRVRMRSLEAMPPKGFTAEQIGWLCRTPYSVLGTARAKELYEQVAAWKLPAAIPIDFKRRAAREARWGICTE